MSTFYSKGRTAGAAAIAAPEEAGNKLVEAEVLFEYLETLCEICWNSHLATYSTCLDRYFKDIQPPMICYFFCERS